LGTTSQQQGGRSEETESKHDERNALDEQNDWRRNTPGSELVLTNRNHLQVIYFDEVTWGVPTELTTSPRYLNFADQKNEEVAQID
jgi:hypothetical protein